MVRRNRENTRKEVVYCMKKKQIDKSWIYGVMVVTLTLALSILPIQAQVPDDLDGFAETGSITLYGGTVYPLCGEGRDRATCLDPATKDLFVILVPASPTKIPSANPLEYISNPMAAGGLGIAVHQIASGQANTSRQVTSSSTQKAMKITESADASKNPDILGTSNYGTPNGLDLATVYTQRIFNFIQSVCGTGFLNNPDCLDSTGVSGQALLDKYVKHTIAHEAGHMMKLTRAYNSSYGGYHYAASTTDPLLIMAQSVKYVRDGSKVTFYLGVNFPSGDQTGALLK
jgi:hypothetical protein